MAFTSVTGMNIYNLLTQSGMSGSWNYWCWGTTGSWRMKRPEMDEGFHGTPFGQRCRPATQPEWNWTISLLTKPPVHWKGKHCCCLVPTIRKHWILPSINGAHTNTHTLDEKIVCDYDMDLPLWRMIPMPGQVLAMPFEREASKQLLELDCYSSGNS